MIYDSRPDTLAHISVVQGHLLRVAADLKRRALVHDRSKLVEPEKAIFDEYSPKLRDTTYGSEEYEQYRREMGVALDHHYAANRHHPEHFEDGIRGMTLVDLVEMLCDWKAAVERHDDGDLRRSIDINQERFGYGDELRRILENTVEAWEAT